MAVSHWRIVTDTRRPDAAERLAAKLQALLGRAFREMNVDAYHKGGHVVAFDMEHDIRDWEATVYDVISCAQQMGQGWSISGCITEELDLVTTRTAIAGIKMVSCFCPRPGTPNANCGEHERDGFEQ